MSIAYFFETVVNIRKSQAVTDLFNKISKNSDGFVSYMSKMFYSENDVISAISKEATDFNVEYLDSKYQLMFSIPDGSQEQIQDFDENKYAMRCYLILDRDRPEEWAMRFDIFQEDLDDLDLEELYSTSINFINTSKSLH
jgi:hypothetical protein